MLNAQLLAPLGILVIVLLAAYFLMPGKPNESKLQAVSATLNQFTPQPQIVERVIERPAEHYLSPRERAIRDDADLIANHFRKSESDRLEREALARHREALVNAAAHEQAMQSVIAQFGQPANANTSTPSRSKA